MAKKQTKKTERTRSEIIFALAKYAHPSWYHDLLDRDTEMLRALLAYYEAGGTEQPPEKKRMHNPVIQVIIVRGPGEPLKNKQRFGKQ